MIPEKPIVFDLFCGLGGWSEAFISEGYEAIGFDIEAHDYGNGGYPGKLVLRDIRSISGADLVREYGVPAIIVASPPCQEFSYMAMPWSKAKQKAAKIMASQEEQVRLKDLFNQCFRIQREVSAAAGRYVPMVVENVRGAQRWVGRSKWNYGSFHLWGDVPALMPMEKKFNVVSFRFDGRGGSFQTASVLRTNPGNGTRFTTRDCGVEAFKHKDRDGYERNHPNAFGWKSPRTGSKALRLRKQASAEIAKIPRPLAQWIARCFKPSDFCQFNPQQKGLCRDLSD